MRLDDLAGLAEGLDPLWSNVSEDSHGEARAWDRLSLAGRNPELARDFTDLVLVKLTQWLDYDEIDILRQATDVVV